jgi:two-component system, OmpR family, response regulator MprA
MVQARDPFGLPRAARSRSTETRGATVPQTVVNDPAGTRPARILVVDDDRAVRDSLRRALGLQGFEVTLAADGMEALRQVQADPPDVVVLDVMMPGVDGIGVVRRLRQDGNQVPILLLTARNTVPDRVSGLTEGADDHLAKPFALEELIARIGALLRRSRTGTDAATVLRFGDLTVELDTAVVRRAGRPIELTRTEYDLLLEFVGSPRRVLSREQLHERVWGHDSDVTANNVEVYIGYLRRKLESHGQPRLIQTIRGFGYVLREP